MYEVEQKHRVRMSAVLVARLAERGVELENAIEQSDQYFAHPCRDFAKTDEALRIRVVGDKSFVTYKGPKLDKTTKTRHEIELPLDAGDHDGAQFGVAARVAGLQAGGRRSQAAADVSNSLSRGERSKGRSMSSSTLVSFVELELMAERVGIGCGEANHCDARDRSAILAPSERRSYLEMLLENLPKLASN